MCCAYAPSAPSFLRCARSWTAMKRHGCRLRAEPVHRAMSAIWVSISEGTARSVKDRTAGRAVRLRINSRASIHSASHPSRMNVGHRRGSPSFIPTRDQLIVDSAFRLCGPTPAIKEFFARGRVFLMLTDPGGHVFRQAWTLACPGKVIQGGRSRHLLAVTPSGNGGVRNLSGQVIDATGRRQHVALDLDDVYVDADITHCCFVVDT